MLAQRCPKCDLTFHPRAGEVPERCPRCGGELESMATLARVRELQRDFAYRDSPTQGWDPPPV